MANGFTRNRQKRTVVAHLEAASVDAVVSEAAEEDVETRLGKMVVTDPMKSHISSVLNVTNMVTTRRSTAAT